MGTEVVYTTSPALWAFVTLILTIAGTKATPAAPRSGQSKAMDCRRILEILIGPGHRTQTCSRLLTLGPFLTLILTLRCRQPESSGACWPRSSLTCGEVESATALQGVPSSADKLYFV